MAAIDGWVDSLKSAQKTCILLNGRRKIHYTFTDGTEMVEEYDASSHELLMRKLKTKPMMGGDGKWEHEIGLCPQPSNFNSEGIAESSSNPIFSRRDTKRQFEWRIRNLPYPLETYDVKTSDDDNYIIIRTSNKKYYKKFQIPDLIRLKLKLVQSHISVAHANNTLIVTYKKPAEVLDFEQKFREELQKLKNEKEGDVQTCVVS